jgi:hypothetical protein
MVKNNKNSAQCENMRHPGPLRKPLQLVRLLKCAFFLALLLAMTVSAWGQAFTATISGVVEDSTDSYIVNATENARSSVESSGSLVIHFTTPSSVWQPPT